MRAAINNRLTSGELLSNDRRVTGFGSIQLGLRGAISRRPGVSGECVCVCVCVGGGGGEW